jgi:hypothetical protein
VGKAWRCPGPAGAQRPSPSWRWAPSVRAGWSDVYRLAAVIAPTGLSAERMAWCSQPSRGSSELPLWAHCRPSDDAGQVPQSAAQVGVGVCTVCCVRDGSPSGVRRRYAGGSTRSATARPRGAGRRQRSLHHGVKSDAAAHRIVAPRHGLSKSCSISIRPCSSPIARGWIPSKVEPHEWSGQDALADRTPRSRFTPFPEASLHAASRCS